MVTSVAATVGFQLLWRRAPLPAPPPADVQPSQLEGKMLQRMRVLEEAGVRFTSKPIKALSTLGGDGGFLHQVSAESL